MLIVIFQQFFNMEILLQWLSLAYLNFSYPVCCSTMYLITGMLFATFPSIEVRVPVLKTLSTV